MTYLMLELHGLQLGLACDGARAMQFSKQALQDMSLREVSKQQAQQCRSLKIAFNAQNWVIDDAHQSKSMSGIKIGDFAYYLTDCVAYHLADQSREYYCVHAGAVAMNGEAVLIVGASGAGKSTLTAWLVAQGAAYITDELSLIHPSGAVLGLPRAIQIKRRGVAAVQSLIKDPAEILTGDMVQGVTVSALRGHINDPSVTLPLGAIVFPEYQPQKAFAVAKLSSAQAGMQLMANYINARNFVEHGFDGLMSLVEPVPAYSLTYTDFESLENVFEFNAQKGVAPLNLPTPYK